MKESEGREEITTFPLYPYLLQGQQALPNCNVSQYQFGAPVTKATGHLHLTQPPHILESAGEAMTVQNLHKRMLLLDMFMKLHIWRRLHSILLSAELFTQGPVV